MGAEALLSQRLPGECWCAPVSTGTELVRKPTGIYWVAAQTLTGFKRFKASYNVKNVRVARNDPHGAYLTAEDVYQAAKGPGCSQCSFDGLSLDDFISAGLVAARRCLKHLSLAPYYAAQMKCCTQKWDRRDEQGLASAMIDTCCQLIGIVGTGLHHLMVDVQLTVS